MGNQSKRPHEEQIRQTAREKFGYESAQALCDKGVKAIFYHAGMKAKEREEAQSAFMNDEAEVIVATTAFGMGVDKPNVRFVFHHDTGSKPFPLSSRVVHSSWGEGVVMR